MKSVRAGAIVMALWLGAVSMQGQLVRGARVVPPPKQSGDLEPSGRGYGINREHNAPRHNSTTGTAGTPTTQAGIYYHGGPIITGTTHVYYIFYGNWGADTSGQSILLDLASHIGGSRYYNINTTYYNSSGTRVSNSVRLNGHTFDNYSKGKYLTDSEVQQVVSNAISSGKLPKDSKGVYFVLTSKDVKEPSGFCTMYCGWHNHASMLGTDIKYAFVGNASAQCPSACEEQTTRSPNGNPGADAMASIVAHELVEAVTDPKLNAWYDKNGAENADKCSWTFGTRHTASNGSQYNLTLGSRQYLIQRNWVNAGKGYCAMKY